MLLGAALLAASSCGRGPAVGARPTAEQLDRGRAIFEGTANLTSRLAQHSEELPSVASRCTNCHRDEAKSIPGSVAAQNSPPENRSATFGPVLNGTSLKKSQPRRGGPPSAYNIESLCTLLRTGIDPAHIVLPPAMPTYEISSMQCADLWAFLESR